jgi:serine/threonine protein kinase
MADSDELFIAPEEIERVKVIGKGAFGDVYLCKWNGKGEGKDVAVKMMNNLGEQQVKDFILEVKVTRYVLCVSLVDIVQHF